MARRPRRTTLKKDEQPEVQEYVEAQEEQVEEASDEVVEEEQVEEAPVEEQPVKKPQPVKTETAPKGKTAMRDFFENQYKVKAAPGSPITEQEGAALQYAFYNEFMAILNAEPEKALEGLNDIRKIFMEEHEGLLSDRYVFRWMNAWQGGAKREKAFLGLVNFFKAIAEKKTMAQVRKIVDLDNLISVLPSERAKDNLSNWISKQR